MTFPLHVTFTVDETGVICVECDNGAITAGRTIREACTNLGEAIECAMGIDCVPGPDAALLATEEAEALGIPDVIWNGSDLVADVVAALRDVPGVASIHVEQVMPSPGWQHFNVVLDQEIPGIELELEVERRMTGIEAARHELVNYMLLPRYAPPPVDAVEVYRATKESPDV